MTEQPFRESLTLLPRVVVLAELARQGSFRAAAKSLGMSSSTVSHHIKALEDALGVRLVERTTRAMSFTTAGQRFLTTAKDILEAWNRGVGDARSLAAAPSGELVVTAPDVLAERFVVPAAGRMLREFSRVTIDVRVAPENLDLVADGIDVAVRMGPLVDSSHGAQRLYRDQLRIFAQPRLAKQLEAVHPRDLVSAPMVRYVVRPESPELSGPAGEAFRLTSVVRARATSGAAQIALVVAGVGFGLLPSRLVAREEENGSLVRLLPQWSAGAADFFVVTRSPKTTDAKILRFVETLIDVMAVTGCRTA